MACGRHRSISAVRKKKPLVPRVGLKFSGTMILVLGNIRRPSKMFVLSPYWDRSRRCALKRSKDDGLHRFFRWLWKLLKNFQLGLRDSQTECEMTVKWLPMKTALKVRIPGGVTEGMFWQRYSTEAFKSRPYLCKTTIVHFSTLVKTRYPISLPRFISFCIQNYVIFHTNNMGLDFIKSHMTLDCMNRKIVGTTNIDIL